MYWRTKGLRVYAVLDENLVGCDRTTEKKCGVTRMTWEKVDSKDFFALIHFEMCHQCFWWLDRPHSLCLVVQVFKPIVEKFGVHFDCDIRMRSVCSFLFPVSVIALYDMVYLCVVRGYYPKGGGEVVVAVNPVKELQPVTMTERGTITKIYGRAFVAGVLPSKVNFLLTPTHTGSDVSKQLFILISTDFALALCQILYEGAPEMVQW